MLGCRRAGPFLLPNNAANAAQSTFERWAHPIREQGCSPPASTRQRVGGGHHDSTPGGGKSFGPALYRASVHAASYTLGLTPACITHGTTRLNPSIPPTTEQRPLPARMKKTTGEQHPSPRHVSPQQQQQEQQTGRGWSWRPCDRQTHVVGWGGACVVERGKAWAKPRGWVHPTEYLWAGTSPAPLSFVGDW